MSYVQFPSQKEIVDYINQHEVKPFLETYFIGLNFHGSIEKVAKFFENKKFTLAEIPNNVKLALEEGTESGKMSRELREMITDHKNSEHIGGFDKALKILDNAIEIATLLYKPALEDLVNKVPPGQKKDYTVVTEGED